MLVIIDMFIFLYGATLVLFPLTFHDMNEEELYYRNERSYEVKIFKTRFRGTIVTTASIFFAIWVFYLY